MTTPQEKAQCVWWYVESKSPVTVQRQFRRQYERDPPSKSCIMRWVKNFQETGSVKDLPRSGRPGVSQQTVEKVQVAFQRSPQKSIRRASRELHVPKSTISIRCCTSGCIFTPIKCKSLNIYSQMTDLFAMNLLLPC